MAPPKVQKPISIKGPYCPASSGGDTDKARGLIRIARRPVICLSRAVGAVGAVSSGRLKDEDPAFPRSIFGTSFEVLLHFKAHSTWFSESNS